MNCPAVQRALALGVTLCGAGVGTFVLSPLETFLTNRYWCAALLCYSSAVGCRYGWRAGLLSLSGLSLGCSLCGLAMTRVARPTWQPAQVTTNIPHLVSVRCNKLLWYFANLQKAMRM